MQIYGQPVSKTGYDIIDSPIFLYWMPVVKILPGGQIQHPFVGGIKIHVSADPADADRIAGALLPLLQARKVSHKVVYPLEEYERMNTGPQRGKFITVYPGPVPHSVSDLLVAMDTMLEAMKARPGLQPLDRQAGHQRPEPRFGRSGLITAVNVADYRK